MLNGAGPGFIAANCAAMPLDNAISSSACKTLVFSPFNRAVIARRVDTRSSRNLDQCLSKTWQERIRTENGPVVAPQHVLQYFLRARALDHPLHAYELGRALYHLGQRRGYKSNRRETRKPISERPGKRSKEVSAGEEERQKVLVEIDGLQRELRASNARTLGEFLSRQDPTIARIRARHTARWMFEEEFEMIWSAQEPHHSILTSDLKHRIHELLFHQRPIGVGKPGMCELEKDCQRADMYTLAAQRFRLLQKVNDLAILGVDGSKQELTTEQRQLLVQHLEQEGDITFEKARVLFGLPKKTKFNLSADGSKKIPGNRTNAAMSLAFGERWGTFSEAERNHIVRLWASENTGQFKRSAVDWGLDPAALQVLADTDPEDSYCKLSLRAIKKLLPSMDQGQSFKTAEARIYGNRFSGGKAKSFLPPVEDVLPQIPNPAVLRALTQLRKVVNQIVRRYGTPMQVRVELARDLKRSAKDRQRLADIMEDKRKRRAKIIKRIQSEAGIPTPSGRDIEKGLLFEELQECAYCGRAISFQNLFSPSPEFDVDHVLPLSRFPDNSYVNKTLACNACNAQKTNRTPFEAFGADTETWDKLTLRLSRIGTDKRRRFMLKSTEEIEDFSARHLADTRYISKLAARYLEELYGGRDQEVPWEDQSRRCVFASSGAVTYTLRKAWGLNSLLPNPAEARDGRPPEKSRNDHRHHAIDAMVVALSNQSAVQQLSTAAAAGDGRIPGRISSRTLQQPWVSFIDSIRPIIQGVIVSHRLDHGLNGPIHDETNYSPVHLHRGKQFVHVRKLVHLLSPANIQSDDVIVDPCVRDAIRSKLAEVGNPKKLETNYPVLVTRTGKQVPIRRVRIRVRSKVQQIGHGESRRHVVLNANHHIAIFETQDNKGHPRWDSPEVVSVYKALQRKTRPRTHHCAPTTNGDRGQVPFFADERGHRGDG